MRKMESKLDIMEGQIDEKTYLLVTDTEIDSAQRIKSRVPVVSYYLR